MSEQSAEPRERHSRHSRHGGGNLYVGLAIWCTDDEADLCWYFCDAPGHASGLRSTWGAQIEALRLGFSALEAAYTDPDDAMVRRLDDAARSREVLRRLRVIGPRHADVLSVLFGGEVPPAAVRARWGERAPVVLLLDPEAAKHRGGKRAAELDEQAAARIEAAKKAYAAARASAKGR